MREQLPHVPRIYTNQPAIQNMQFRENIELAIY